MADTPLSAAEAEVEFWRHLSKSNTGMLGLDQPGYHSQPMTAFRDEETDTIWFFTRNDTDLAKDAKGGKPAMFTYMAKDQHVFACIHGSLSQELDREKVERWWNPVVAAWYPEGKEDPHLTMLKFTPGDGRIWVSEKGVFGFAYEILKANITHTTPDSGGVADVRLS
jgi:general stress protein 26